MTVNQNTFRPIYRQAPLAIQNRIMSENTLVVFMITFTVAMLNSNVFYITLIYAEELGKSTIRQRE